MSEQFDAKDELAPRLAGMGPDGPISAACAWIDRVVIWVATVIVCITLTAIFVILLGNVVLRYLFDSGWTWSQEVSVTLFPWLVISGAVLAAQVDKHIAVSVILNLLPRIIRRTVLVAVNVLIVAMAVVVVDAALVILPATKRVVQAVTGIPQSWGYSALIYGYTMIGLTALTTCWRVVRGDFDTRAAGAAGSDGSSAVRLTK